MDVVYKKVEAFGELIDAIRLRVDVFILEQGFKPGWEPDEEDKDSEQFIALKGGKVISTARVREVRKGEFRIERMATAKESRGKNIGRGLLRFILKEISKRKPENIWLRSQVQSRGFYEKCGFTASSKQFDQWGVLHVDMSCDPKTL